MSAVTKADSEGSLVRPNQVNDQVNDYGCKDILIRDVRIVWQTKDIIIYVADSVDG